MKSIEEIIRQKKNEKDENVIKTWTIQNNPLQMGEFIFEKKISPILGGLFKNKICGYMETKHIATITKVLRIQRYLTKQDMF